MAETDNEFLRISLFDTDGTAAPVTIEVLQPHGLSANGLPLTPDIVTAFPWSPGGLVEPTGIPILSTLPTNTEFGMRNVAGAQLTARCYVRRTHSLQGGLNSP